MSDNRVRAPYLLLYNGRSNSDVARVARAIAPDLFYAHGVRELSRFIRIATSFKLPLVLTGPDIGLVGQIRQSCPLAFIGVVSSLSTRRREFLEAGADIYWELDSRDQYSVTLAANAVKEAADHHVGYLEYWVSGSDDRVFDPAELRPALDYLVGLRWKRDPEWRKKVGGGAFGVSNGCIIGPAASADELNWNFRAMKPGDALMIFVFD